VKENHAMTATANLADVLPGQDFKYQEQTLRMVKVSKTQFRAETAAGDVKTFKAPSSRTVELVTGAEHRVLLNDPNAPVAEGAVFTQDPTVKWRGKVRETKTVVSILDAGKDAKARWITVCEDHKKRATHPNSTEAWAQAAHPTAWCSKCATSVL
jgi:hypothetical protein